jgi:FkbM family methyltransferase
MQELATQSQYHKSRFWRFSEADAARLEFYRRLIGAGDLVFDVGANLGRHTKIFRRLGARVVAFEPQDHCAAVLNAALHDDEQFKLIAKALGSSAGRTQMLISDATALSSLSAEWVSVARRSGRLREWSWGKTQWVDVTTLDRMIEQLGRPQFINIDVEGFELEVLLGLTAPVPLLSLRFACEFLDRALRCVDHLEALADEIEFQLLVGDQAEFDLAGWVSGRIARATLLEFIDADPLASGSIFARVA